MKKPAKDLREAATKLSPEDQLRVVDVILASLDPEGSDVSKAWSDELRSRIAAFERGDYGLEDADNVFAESRAALRRRGSGSSRQPRWSLSESPGRG